jgi:hypothetical protein
MHLKFNNQIPLSLHHCDRYLDVYIAARSAVKEITLMTYGVEKPNTLLLPSNHRGREAKEYLAAHQIALDLEFIELGLIEGLPDHLSNLWMTIAVFDRNQDPMFFPMSASIKVLY